MTCQHCQKLQSQNNELEAKVYRLECLLRDIKAIPEPYPTPREWRLSITERMLVRMLMEHIEVPREKIYAILYSNRKPPDSENIIAVWMNHINKKLRPYNIRTRVIWGYGYYYDKETKAKVRKLCEESLASSMRSLANGQTVSQSAAHAGPRH